MRRRGILLIMMLYWVVNVFAQENVSLLLTDSTWVKEEFQFPLSFAPKIQFNGIEEAYFPTGWKHKDSDEFWSYIFVWAIDSSEMLTTQEIESNLQLYFDGLMRVKDSEKHHSTIAVFVEEESGAIFRGKVRTLDAFFSKEPMLLYATVEQRYCMLTNRLLVGFRFSPQSFSENIWTKLNGVRWSVVQCAK